MAPTEQNMDPASISGQIERAGASKVPCLPTFRNKEGADLTIHDSSPARSLPPMQPLTVSTFNFSEWLKEKRENPDSKRERTREGQISP